MITAFAITKIVELKLPEVLTAFAADLCHGEHFQGILRCVSSFRMEILRRG